MNDQPKPSRFSQTAAQRRLDDFCILTDRTPPAGTISEHGAVTDEFLLFCRETGASLDWLFLGDPLPMMLNIYSDRKRSKVSSLSLAVILAQLTADKRREVFAMIEVLTAKTGLGNEPPTEASPTIAGLFEEWRNLEREALGDETGEDRMKELLNRCYEIEEQAVSMPAKTALDVWCLIRMAIPNDFGWLLMPPHGEHDAASKHSLEAHTYGIVG